MGFKVIFIAVLGVLSVVASPLTPFNPPAYTFDIDDTLLNLPTTIRLFHKTDPTQFIDLGTGEYAEKYILKGDAELAQNYQIIVNDKADSFFRFRTAEAMREDLLKAMNDPHWRGKALDEFMNARRTREGASLISICSARAVPPPGFLEFVLPIVDEWYAKNRGWKGYPIPESAIFMVGNEPSVPKAKAEKILGFLDQIEASGKATKWIYYDDDQKNVDSVVQMIREQEGRWKNLELDAIHVNKGIPEDAQPLINLPKSLHFPKGGMRNLCSQVFSTP